MGKKDRFIKGLSILRSEGLAELYAKLFRYYQHEYYQVTNKDIEDYHASLITVSKHFSQPKSLNDDLIAPIHTTFNARGVRSQLLGLEWWRDFVTAANIQDIEGHEIQGRLIGHINAMNVHDLEHWELLHVYALALRVGLFNVGYTLRKKARDEAVHQFFCNKQKKAHLVKKLAALLENGHYADFKESLDLLGKPFIFEKEQFFNFYQIIKPQDNDNKSSTGLIDEHCSEEELDFAQLVQGKSIAIVGPAKTESKDAKLIDSHDLVIRFYYREDGVGVDPMIKGLRCDITYFNGEQTTDFCKFETINWPHDIKWVVCKTRDHAVAVAVKLEHITKHRITEKPYSFRLRTRNLKLYNSILFNGTLNAIPNAVLDLLRFYPDSIRIFHADLMLTVERNTGYHPEEWQFEKEMRSIFLISASKAHDPVTQYWILNTLWKQGKVQGDIRFNEVMSLGEEEYMRQLQKIYGNAGRIKNVNQ